MTPPPLAHRVLERWLQPDERDEIIGDLDEHYARRAAAAGARARLWYWRQTLTLLWRFSRQRRDVISTAHERTRGMWAVGNCMVDIRHAWRALRHSPGFALVTLLTLTLGIGLSTTVYSLVHGVLLRPLPIAGADRVVRLGQIDPSKLRGFDGMIFAGSDAGPSLSDVTIGQWLERGRTLQALSPYSPGDTTVVTPSETIHISYADVGGHYFEIMPATPERGRVIAPQDDVPDTEPAVVISDRFWRDHLASRADVIGLPLTVDGRAAHIVGVMSAGYQYPSTNIDLWKPGQWRWPPPGRARMFGMQASVVGRMKPASTIDAVRTEGQDILAAIAEADPAFPDGTVSVPKIHVSPILDDIVAPVRPALTLLGAAMACVLLAACVNLASLLLSRNTSRHRDIAVRLALGASRWRIVRPLMIEQLMLAAGGAALGSLAAWWMLRALPHLAPADMPRLGDVRFDVASLVFAATTAGVTALVVGILPAWQVPSRNLREFASSSALASFGVKGSADAMRSALVVCQVALAAVLLAGTALIARSLIALVHVDPGYRPAGVLTFQVALPESIYQQKGRERQFFTDLEARLRANPRVTGVGHAASLPLHSGGSASTFDIEGRQFASPADRPKAHRDGVTYGYFDAIGARLLRGRTFGPQDSIDAEPVVVINDTFARNYFPQEDPIGHRVSIRARVYARIIGVVASAHLGPLTADAQPAVFESAEQAPEIMGYGFSTAGAGMVVRTTGDPLDLVPYVREQIRAVEPTFPLFNPQRLDDALGETFAQPRFYALTLAVFALLAVSTATLGLYGVLAYAVERRRLEFGVRRALGADARHIVSLVARRAAILAAIGLPAGLLLAALSARLMRTLLFGVQPDDPLSFALAALTVMAIVVAASWVPARRALSIEPSKALRVE